MPTPAPPSGSEAHLACAGCGTEVSLRAAYPFRCPRQASGDGGDHVLRAAGVRWPRALPASGDPQPFVRFRDALLAGARARLLGLDERAFIALVHELDAAVAAVDGRGFRVTPLVRHAALSSALGFAPSGGVFVKDETGNVAGSHKGRHLFGLLLHLELARRCGLAAEPPRLAIASCGNAALAAAVVARAGGYPLTVFVPPDAPAAVLARLRALEASIEVCPRVTGSAGDPCVLRFQAACAAGALPFCCQGNHNGLTIDGGLTLGLELAAELARQGRVLDALFVQVGGGALASACVQALTMAVGALALPRLPRLHAVQTTGCAPLARAYLRLLARVEQRAGLPGGLIAERAARAAAPASSQALAQELAAAAAHRAAFMTPWEQEPKSLARGILDDETYDWHALTAGILRSGGWPLVVDEATLREAWERGKALTGIAVDATGAAGLAGLLQWSRSPDFDPGATVAVIFSGVERQAAP